MSDPKTIKTNGNGSIIHRLDNRCVLRHISDVYISWAVLGGQGCREKKFQVRDFLIKYATFEESFVMFKWAKKFFFSF